MLLLELYESPFCVRASERQKSNNKQIENAEF